jgi:hypothetical protein
LRRHGEHYTTTHPVSSVQRKAIRALSECRTAALGGHLEACDRCGHRRAVYHSCRNRHCPKCQALAQADWIEARRDDLLPVEYFHVVFTLPHELCPLALYRPRVVYDLLFRVATETLSAFVPPAGQGRMTIVAEIARLPRLRLVNRRVEVNDSS